jgi:hypothetical protein
MNEMDDFEYTMRRIDTMAGELRSVKTWLKVLTAIVVLSVLLGCGMTSPTGPSPAEVSGFEPMDYWPVAENRVLNWLYINPQCGDNYVTPSITMREGNPATCEYSPDNDVVIYNPAMLDGCIAHELGHAALEQAGNDCWRPYEHDAIAPQRPEGK